MARAFLLSPYSTGLFQKAQAVLFRLLLTASKVQDIHLSSSNPSINSTNSLLDGIYGLIQRFRVRLEQRGECTGSQFFSNREEAAAFCSIRILDNLSNHPLNREHLVRHKGFHTALASLFSISVLQRHFVVAVQNILNSCHALLHESAEYDVLVDAMLSKLEKAACIQSNNDDDVPPDLDVSAKALSFLASCTPGVTTCERAIAIASKLLHLQYRIGDTISLSLLACGLVSKYPDRLEGNDSFRAGVFKLLHDPRCTSAVVEILRMMRVLWPLQDCVKDIRQMAELHDHSNQQWQELSEVLHDIAAAPAETAVVEELDKILFSTRVFECHEGNVNATSGDGVLDLLSKSKPLHWEI